MTIPQNEIDVNHIIHPKGEWNQMGLQAQNAKLLSPFVVHDQRPDSSHCRT